MAKCASFARHQSISISTVSVEFCLGGMIPIDKANVLGQGQQFANFRS